MFPTLAEIAFLDGGKELLRSEKLQVRGELRDGEGGCYSNPDGSDEDCRP